MATAKVKGLSDLQKFLDQLPAKVEKNYMRQALRAGATVIAKAAKANVPVGPPGGENAKKYGGYAGALRDSIRVTTKYKAGKVTADVKVGGMTRKGADVYYAHFIEFTGAKAHVIKGGIGKPLAFAGGIYNTIHHPGMHPKPFLRPALDANAGAALVAVGEYIKARLAKAGIDASGVTLEEEA